MEFESEVLKSDVKKMKRVIIYNLWTSFAYNLAALPLMSGFQQSLLCQGLTFLFSLSYYLHYNTLDL
jgi:hypothetical protein